MIKKRDQKKLGNKGFSLVELIVVIAIMAILVGVLAPVLIKNIEKSRESKDLQNLDSARQAIVTALADEKAFQAIPNGGYKGTYAALPSDIKTAADAIIGKDPTMTSKVGKATGVSVYVNIDTKGNVIVYAGTSVEASSAVECTYAEENNAKQKLASGSSTTTTQPSSTTN